MMIIRAALAAALALCILTAPVAQAQQTFSVSRSAIRNMRRAGVAESVAMTISGHQSPLVFKRYDITSHEDQRSALAATEAYRAQRRAAKVTPLNTDKTRTMSRATRA